MNKQIFIVHGGMTFKNRGDYLAYLQNRPITLKKKSKWHSLYIEESLGKKYTVIKPRMPLQDNARYEEWKIVFERYLALLEKDTVFIGISLGGIFLAKYFSEHKLKRKPLSLYLVAAPFDNNLGGEDLVGGFKLKSDLTMIEKNTKNLYLLFSDDDEVVNLKHAEKYKKKLEGAEVVIFSSKNGHFRVEEFPEIIEMIKGDYRDLARKAKK